MVHLCWQTGHRYLCLTSALTRMTLPGRRGVQHFSQGNLTAGMQISLSSTRQHDFSFVPGSLEGTHVLQGTSR